MKHFTHTNKKHNSRNNDKEDDEEEEDESSETCATHHPRHRRLNFFGLKTSHPVFKNLFQIQKCRAGSLWECDHDLDEST